MNTDFVNLELYQGNKTLVCK